jgi:hypothetical protein
MVSPGLTFHHSIDDRPCPAVRKRRGSQMRNLTKRSQIWFRNRATNRATGFRRDVLDEICPARVLLWLSGGWAPGQYAGRRPRTHGFTYAYCAAPAHSVPKRQRHLRRRRGIFRSRIDAFVAKPYHVDQLVHLRN